MIPQQTLENYPVFGDTATKVAPDDAKYSAGFQQSDVLPAEWMNWAWNKNSKGITDLNSGVASIEKELIAVLTAAGITPSLATENQVITAINAINNKVYSIATDTSVTPDGHMRYVINADVTLTLGSSAVPAGTEISVLFVTAGKVAYKAITGDTVTDTINASRLLKYVFTGTAWLCSSAPEIGSIEKQYPDQDEPSKLYGGQWVENNYGGAFERSVGTNAKDFQRAYEGVTVSGTNVTFANSNAPTSSQLAAGDIIIAGDEYRVVSSYSESTRIAVIASAFTSTEITTVIIGQNSTNKSHNHSIKDPGHIHAYSSGYYGQAGFASGALGMTALISENTASSKTGITINSSGGTESRPTNLTVKIWKRVS